MQMSYFCTVSTLLTLYDYILVQNINIIIDIKLLGVFASHKPFHLPIRITFNTREDTIPFPLQCFTTESNIPDNTVHGANMGPTWVFPAPGGPHVGPMNLAIRDVGGGPTLWNLRISQLQTSSYDVFNQSYAVNLNNHVTWSPWLLKLSVTQMFVPLITLTS